MWLSRLRRYQTHRAGSLRLLLVVAIVFQAMLASQAALPMSADLAALFDICSSTGTASAGNGGDQPAAPHQHGPCCVLCRSVASPVTLPEATPVLAAAPVAISSPRRPTAAVASAPQRYSSDIGMRGPPALAI